MLDTITFRCINDNINNSENFFSSFFFLGIDDVARSISWWSWRRSTFVNCRLDRQPEVTKYKEDFDFSFSMNLVWWGTFFFFKDHKLEVIGMNHFMQKKFFLTIYVDLMLVCIHMVSMYIQGILEMIHMILVPAYIIDVVVSLARSLTNMDNWSPLVWNSCFPSPWRS